MSKQLSDAPLKPDEQIAPATTGNLPAPETKKQPAVFWPWLGGLLLVGLVIVVVITSIVWNWLNSVQKGINAAKPTVALASLNVQRSSYYAGLNITLLNAQYATSFSDDLIHSSPATVRVTLRVHNPTKSTIALACYDDVRLLVPGQKPIAPTNLNLTSAPQPGATQTGWLDFPVSSRTALNSLKLQLGNAAVHEQLVVIPVSGPYNANQYVPHTYHPALTVYYYFKGWLLPPYTLTYHLTSVDVQYAYNGVQVGSGQQFYVLNFSVDNPNGASVAPGWAHDYVRLQTNGLRTPIDATLPDTFKPNAQNVTGRVVFSAPAGMRALTIVFLRQAVAGGDPYPISW